MSSQKLGLASPAEILRSHQRDDDFINQLSESVTDILHRYGIYRVFSKFTKSEIPAKLFYFLVTTGSKNQTLGEEYTGIVQATLSKKKVPTFMTRFLAAMLECFGEQLVLKILERFQKKVNEPNSKLTPEAVTFLNICIIRLQQLIPIIILAHRGLFYIYGRYYSISRRLTGIDFVKVYGPRSNKSVNWGLNILGLVTFAQCLFKLWQARKITTENIYIDKELDSFVSSRCQLCLEKVPNTTTPCGHLFCWNCLAEWLRARNRCPLCREIVTPSRIVPLMNL